MMMKSHHSSYAIYLELIHEVEETGDSVLKELANDIGGDGGLERIQGTWDEAYRRANGISVKLCGIELHNARINQWATILVDPTDPAQYRAQYYAPNGFHGHACYAKADEVLDNLIQEGFTSFDTGAMERLAVMPEWAYGSAVTSTIQQVNAGQITFSEGDQQLDELKAQYQVA